MYGHWKEWVPGDWVRINRIVWGQPEADQLQDVLDNDWFGPGQKVEKFANILSDYTGIEYVQPVNSGSSALMLAVRALMEAGHWQEGDWILHPLLTFPTSIAPALQCGLNVLFVDVDPNTFQIDLGVAEKALDVYGNKVEGAIVPHLLGNICDMSRLAKILDGRPLVEDCCDTMGGYYQGTHVGNFGDIAAFSFYGSHHVTTGGVGGAYATNNERFYDLAKSMTHWGRVDYGSLEDDYDRFAKRYWYKTLGYDFQMTELQAAFGIVQVARLNKANRVRHQRYWQVDDYFRGSTVGQWFNLPDVGTPGCMPSMFCYPLVIKPDAPFDRRQFATYLMKNKIEIRPLFTGNILNHPAFQRIPGSKKIVYGDTTNADLIGENGLFLPSWGMSDEEAAYMIGVLDSFFSEDRGSAVKCHQ